MPTITYLDDEQTPPKRTSDEQPDTSQPHRHRPAGAQFIVLFLFLSLVMGLVGAVGGVLLVTSTSFGKALGLTNNGATTLGFGSKETIVLEESSKVSDVAEQVSPSVVSISTSTKQMDVFGRVFESKGGGTGFIITADGLIVTNKHVVDDESATYTVFTSNGDAHEAKVLAKDPLNDLAVLKIEASSLPVLELGDSDNLKIGQHVVAIGNALGEFSNSVTTGVISAKERQIQAQAGRGVVENLSGLLQTDAAINPGNSGGPLVNLAGQVIGINTAVAGGAENIGFAIPINVVKKAIESVKSTGEIKRPQMGVRYVPITKEFAKLNQLPVDHGVLLVRGSDVGQLAVVPGSPADKAGLEEGDIITEISGENIDENHPLLALLAKHEIGETVALTVLKDGETKKLELELGELK